MSAADLFDFTRIADWIAAINRVRTLYAEKHGRPLRLVWPRRFTEKMQWRKLFDLNPIYPIISDKLAVRDYIAARVGPDLLVPLLWAGDDPAAVPIETLVLPFVVKGTHGSGFTLMVFNRESLNVESARAQMAHWLGIDFGARQDEPAYSSVPRRIMVESMLTGPGGGALLERRLYTFGGRVRLVQTSVVNDEQPGLVRNAAFHDTDWNRLPWILNTPYNPDTFERPQRLSDMIAVAERLGRDFDHLRVDFFDGGDRFWIGELTLYSWSGLDRFRPDEADFILGACWRLKNPFGRACKAVLSRRRRIPVSSATPR